MGRVPPKAASRKSSTTSWARTKKAMLEQELVTGKTLPQPTRAGSCALRIKRNKVGNSGKGKT
jgi:hypothetical protein